LLEEERKRIVRQKKNIMNLFGTSSKNKRRKIMTSKGDWPRPVNQKKFDEQFDRIFKKEKKKGGDSKESNG
tara:strand:- start:10 stop:222 length:213 start_codon:yes stop_codon:yes gene_type:complete